ncbi:hypothetical protein ACPRNU_21765, partial [Chromobacterium vaccinii]|uniref:hypothetical protein n=1 Tax=Chromobacterium vaccinii TaxID=1108595 RepID=UPI003C771503
RPTHVALRGESKCGKSWLRQRIISDPLTVQCRLGRTVRDIYIDALSQLQVNLILEEGGSGKFVTKFEASGDVGVKLLVKIAGKFGIDLESSSSIRLKPTGKDLDDLKFIAEIIVESGRRLVVEDFHYLSIEERQKVAFDLKALWDYGLFVIVIGVWNENNMLLVLNPDLSGRIEEISVVWSIGDLSKILQEGGDALRVSFSDRCKYLISEISFGSPGVTQRIALRVLDRIGVEETQKRELEMDDASIIEEAAAEYAAQLVPLYNSFAKRVSKGIRERKDSTGIYAHAMAVIMDAPDELLVKGFHVKEIFDECARREPRIILSNLKAILCKFEELQADLDGRGLVLAYNNSTCHITVVDRQLLLYRKYTPVSWPWEEIIEEAFQGELDI